MLGIRVGVSGVWWCRWSWLYGMGAELREFIFQCCDQLGIAWNSLVICSWILETKTQIGLI